MKSGGVITVANFRYPTLGIMLIVGMAVVAYAPAAEMKLTQTTLAMPAEGEVVELAGLHYGISAPADITTSVYEAKAGKRENRVTTVWTFTGSNRGEKMRRVEVTVWLLNEIGERVARGGKMVTLDADAENQTIKVNVKVTLTALQETKLVNVQANWVT
jgi:hypothetical protein